jgi:hypothetical protein
MLTAHGDRRKSHAREPSAQRAGDFRAWTHFPRLLYPQRAATLPLRRVRETFLRNTTQCRVVAVPELLKAVARSGMARRLVGLPW